MVHCRKAFGVYDFSSDHSYPSPPPPRRRSPTAYRRPTMLKWTPTIWASGTAGRYRRKSETSCCWETTVKCWRTLSGSQRRTFFRAAQPLRSYQSTISGSRSHSSLSCAIRFDTLHPVIRALASALPTECIAKGRLFDSLGNLAMHCG
jgi:hypothetical protein